MGPGLRLVPTGPLPQSDKGVTAIVRMHLRASMVDAFLPIARDLQQAVMAGEEGCLSFSLHRAMGQPDTFVVVARFRSWEALQAHWSSPHLAAANAAGATLVRSPPELELFEEF